MNAPEVPVAPIRRRGRWATFLLALGTALACAGGARAADIVDALRAVPGMRSVTEVPTLPSPPQYRFFVLELEQPADHADASSGTFPQRATLLYRSASAPVVFAPAGYLLGVLVARQLEPTSLLAANQLVVEHRFFGTSVPSPRDWRLLDVRQAAGDHHRWVEALRPLLPGRWISTGASKGGLTAIFHRMLFPDDVFGTLAYVAPLAYGTEDPRYLTFLESLGDPACRAALHAFQQALVASRAEIERLLADDAARNHDAFTSLPVSTAFEYALVETPFVFWQYGTADLCGSIPPPGASAVELFAFLNTVWVGSAALNFSDGYFEMFAAYFYQAATQLGYPAVPQAHLEALLGHHVEDVPRNYPPFGIDKPFDSSAMPGVQAWVIASGRRIVFVYGENDPWSAGAFEPCRRDCALFVVPAGNHTSNLAKLPDVQRETAVGMLRWWAYGAPEVVSGEPPLRVR